MENNRTIQTSDSFMVGVFLALAGGCMDAYSYLCRGGVFANAETGNIVRMAINIASCEWSSAAYYLVPVLSFSFGVILANLVKSKIKNCSIVHWRQIMLLVEIVILTAAAFIPQSGNAIVNSGISFVCGAQVSAFAKFHDYRMATTMCTGNLRSGNQNLYQYFQTKDIRYLQAALIYLGSIVVFIIGAIIGKTLSVVLHEQSILVAAGILVIPLIMMFWTKKTDI